MEGVGTIGSGLDLNGGSELIYEPRALARGALLFLRVFFVNFYGYFGFRFVSRGRNLEK